MLSEEEILAFVRNLPSTRARQMLFSGSRDFTLLACVLEAWILARSRGMRSQVTFVTDASEGDSHQHNNVER